MKKILMVLVILLVISGAAFAQHPKGWGVGVVGQYGFVWDGFDGNGGAALSLKAPMLPIYWGVNLDFSKDYFGIGVTGDYYFIDKALVPDINLGWYIGLGGYAAMTIFDDPSYFYLGLGARIPVGIYIMPLDFLEIFLDIAPSLGLDIGIGDDAPDNFNFPAGRLTFDIGIRFWF